MTLKSASGASFRIGAPLGAGPAWAARLTRKAGLSPATIESLARTLAMRDAATHRHAQRVQRYALALARENRIEDADLLEAIRAGALLHDIGKLGIDEGLLSKPGPLTPEEYDAVKQHAALGADLLSGIPFRGPLALIVRHHHENWDGTGYPDGLRGEAIPLGSRVLAVVDCYDALTSERPYRREMSHDDAMAMIAERRGTMYDPAILDAFLRTMCRATIAAARHAHAISGPVRELLRIRAWTQEEAAL